jgi:hypothetical protein
MSGALSCAFKRRNTAMNDTVKATLVGDPIDSPIAKPPSREQRIEAWRKEHEAAYKSACDHEQCTCTPTRAEALLISQWHNPPID